MRRLALISSPGAEPGPDLESQDASLVTEMTARGWEVHFVDWREPVGWEAFDAALVRSAWDYHLHLTDFLDRMMGIEARTPLANSARLVSWNARKTYLAELAALGCPVVPHEFYQGTPDLSGARARMGGEVVIKPTVGASAFLTYRVNSESDLDRIVAEFDGRPSFVQPFVSSIASLGETSLVYFGGAFSHAVNKRPCEGDFRVQEELGGKTVPCEPTAEQLAAGDAVVSVLEEQPLYARVDLVSYLGRPHLMELELIEPVLYLSASDQAPVRMADAVEDWVGR